MFVSFYAIIYPLDVFGYFCWVDTNLLHVKKLVWWVKGGQNATSSSKVDSVTYMSVAKAAHVTVRLSQDTGR